MHHPTDRIAHTTPFVTPVVEHWLEREIAQWVHPLKNRSDDPSHHDRTLLPRSYISPPYRRKEKVIFNDVLKSLLFPGILRQKFVCYVYSLGALGNAVSSWLELRFMMSLTA